MRRALVLGLVAGVVVLGTRRRFRRQVANACRLPLALALALLVAPLDILDDIWGGVTDVAGAIKDWVLGVVHHLENIVEGWINDLWNAVSSVGSWVANLFDSAIDFASSLVRTVYGWVTTLADSIVRWAEQALADLSRWLSGLVDTLVRWAEEAVNGLWSFVGGIFKWVEDNVLTPLYDVFLWLWHNVVEPAVDWLTGLIGSVFDWVYGLAKQLWQSLADIGDWIWGWATKLLRVVEKAFDWLVMLAEHGPGWVIGQVTDAFKRIPEFLLHGLQTAIQTKGPDIEKMLSDWLG